MVSCRPLSIFILILFDTYMLANAGSCIAKPKTLHDGQDETKVAARPFPSSVVEKQEEQILPAEEMLPLEEIPKEAENIPQEEEIPKEAEDIPPEEEIPEEAEDIPPVEEIPEEAEVIPTAEDIPEQSDEHASYSTNVEHTEPYDIPPPYGENLEGLTQSTYYDMFTEKSTLYNLNEYKMAQKTQRLAQEQKQKTTGTINF